MLLASLFLTACFAFASGANYTSEPSVKLLSVNFFAKRFPATRSEYRIEIFDGEVTYFSFAQQPVCVFSFQNDSKYNAFFSSLSLYTDKDSNDHFYIILFQLQDVPADRSDLEEANAMPEQKLVLRPGGFANYELPIIDEMDQEEAFLMVHPGKKIHTSHGRNKTDYSEKADITLTATLDSSHLKINCSVDNTDTSNQPSDYCLLNITSLVKDTSGSWPVLLTIRVPDTEIRIASLWEVWVSPEEDSNRVKGTFADNGRQRLGEIQQKPEFNTWLTFTSVVGKTGVGKSTVASFLAGNISMFTSASSSHGTTTVGTDVSPIIPSQDYIQIMNDNLLQGVSDFTPDIYQPSTARPLFFLDSEGIAFRGKEFDFITSGPAAIIAKMIVWITTDRI